MAKITAVRKARQDQGKCGKCGREIKVGDPYRHTSPGFRGQKKVRCLDPRCMFRPSDLTTSKLAEVYAAQEDAEDQLDGLVDTDFEEVDDITSILHETADRAREVAGEYSEAADAMGDAGYENQERADTIESWCYELETVSFDDPPEEEAGDEEWETWREDVISAAREALGALEL